MARERDTNRWNNGKEHWNQWAEELLEEKKALQRSGEWSVDENGHGANEPTRDWIDAASVDFSGRKFTSNLDFRDVVFPHEANFATTKFVHRADFGAAKFFGSANFRDATFQSVARFNSTQFHEHAVFRRSAFLDNAWFIGSIFKDKAVFSEANFNKTANFSGSKFFGFASFNSVESTRPFSLTDARFAEVPVFTQAIFRAPVRLDNLEVPGARPLKPKGDKERAAHYRALKKIAIESHDHLRELKFFAGEIRERRCNDDPWWHVRYWAGFFYELSSGFGQSIFLPIVWLCASFVGFSCLYGWQAPAGYMLDCKWPETSFLPEFYLSFLNSLPLVGFARARGREQAEACLFASSEKLNPLMDIVFVCQNIWSAVLIFLLLLAIRNHFRIK